MSVHGGVRGAQGASGRLSSEPRGLGQHGVSGLVCSRPPKARCWRQACPEPVQTPALGALAPRRARTGLGPCARPCLSWRLSGGSLCPPGARTPARGQPPSAPCSWAPAHPDRVPRALPAGHEAAVAGGASALSQAGLWALLPRPPFPPPGKATEAWSAPAGPGRGSSGAGAGPLHSPRGQEGDAAAGPGADTQAERGGGAAGPEASSGPRRARVCFRPRSPVWDPGTGAAALTLGARLSQQLRQSKKLELGWRPPQLPPLPGAGGLERGAALPSPCPSLTLLCPRRPTVTCCAPTRRSCWLSGSPWTTWASSPWKRL